MSWFHQTLVFSILVLGSLTVQAASCCGGGSAAGLTLSKFHHQMLDVSFSYEKYDGYWNQEGQVKQDPPGSDLSQMRLNLGYAQRFSSRWQGHVSLPLVWNDNQYGSIQSHTHGWGDTQLGFLYESFDGIQCIYKVTQWRDLLPTAYWGMMLTLPTGVSPYDNENNSFDITGRGFYRLDASLLMDKTIYPWTVRISTVYGYHFERSIQKEYGQAVAPYRRQLGNRWVMGFGGGYSKALPSRWTLTSSLDFSQIREAEECIDGIKDPHTGTKKTSVILGLSASDVMKKWILKASWDHALPNSDWGRNFPITDTFTVGCSYVLQ
jgi:hypothetical protein